MLLNPTFLQIVRMKILCSTFIIKTNKISTHHCTFVVVRTRKSGEKLSFLKIKDTETFKVLHFFFEMCKSCRFSPTTPAGVLRPAPSQSATSFDICITKPDLLEFSCPTFVTILGTKWAGPARVETIYFKRGDRVRLLAWGKLV